MDFVTISEEPASRRSPCARPRAAPPTPCCASVCRRRLLGFQYLLEYDERRDDDHVLELDGLTIVIDPFSAPLLAGTVLEYDGGLGGKGFEFRNPQVEAGCGCGP